MYKNSKRLLSVVTLITVLSMLLAACGGGAASPAATTAPGGGAATSAPGGGGAATSAPGGGGAATSAPGGGGAAGAFGGVTCPDGVKGQSISMWSPLTGPDGNTMTAIANDFCSNNPWGLKVTHLPQPDFYQKLGAATAAKNLPEAIVIHLENIPEWSIRGALQPMSSDVLAIVGDIKSDFPEQIWSHGEFKGQRYSVPLDVHPLVLYYNKEMFKAAGLTEPSPDKPLSKAEFEKDVDALNKNGVAGISLGNAFQAAALFQGLIRQFGGSMANDDGTKATFNSDAGVRALTYLNDLKKKYSPAPSGAGDPEVKVFQQGKAAMTIHGPWHITDMEKLGFVGYAPVPQIGDKYAVWGGSHNLAITATDKTKQLAAGCWIAWLSKNSIQWAKAGLVPIRNSARNDPQLKTLAPPIAGFASEASAVAVWPEVPGIVDALWGQGSGVAIDAVLLGQATDIKKALDDAAAKSDKIIADNAQKYKTP